MPSTAAFQLTDGVTPIDFRPDSVSATNVLFYEDADKPMADLQKVNYDRPQNGTAIRRSMRINVPHKVNEGTAEESTIWLTAKVEFVMDKKSTAAMRKALVDYTSSLVSQTASRAVVESPEWFW